jgi:cysteine desulfurase
VIYLDYAATTPCDVAVVDAMLPFFRETFANASSIDHLPGHSARLAIEAAREAVAELAGARPEDVIFTSGSTEANNLALSVPFRVLSTAVEHPSVLDSFKARQVEGDDLIAVDNQGCISIGDLREKLNSDSPTLIGIIATNNETGVEQDIPLILDSARSVGALVHLDATQAVGTRRFALERDGIDGIAISAHKIYGPKGVGALIASSRLRRVMRPVLRGGGHERGLRSGTLNVPGIVGFGVAARLAIERYSARREALLILRERFLEALRLTLGDRVVETITTARTSPHVLSLRLKGTNARALLRAVRDEVAFSLGSACATNKTEPSHVLLALGLEKRPIAETIRVSFSAEQTTSEVVAAAGIIAAAAESLSGYSIQA